MDETAVNNYYVESKDLIQFSKFEESIRKSKNLNIDFKINFIFVESWLFSDSDYCQAGDEICKLKAMGNNGVDYNLSIKLHQGKGFLSIIKKEGAINENENFFTIKQSPEDEDIINTLALVEDHFSNTHRITWKRVAANNSIDSKLNGFFLTKLNNGYRLFISIHNIDGKDFLIIDYPSSDFDIKPGDSLKFLLESKQIISLTFNQSSYDSHKSPLTVLKKIKESKIQLTEADLLTFTKFKIIDCKLILNTGSEVSGFTPDPQFKNACRTKEDLSILLQDMFSKYVQAAANLPSRKTLDSYRNDLKEQSNEAEICHVYLMVDTVNGFHKIGISNKPEYRERTLQSEKPSIELIASKQFPSRVIAESIEKALHNSFKQRNIRGEWFQLTQDEIEQIKTTLL